MSDYERYEQDEREKDCRCGDCIGCQEHGDGEDESDDGGHWEPMSGYDWKFLVVVLWVVFVYSWMVQSYRDK